MDNGKINLTYDGRVSLSFQLAIPHAPDKVWKVVESSRVVYDHSS